MSVRSDLNFPYLEFEATPFPSSKRKFVIHRPVIPITLVYRKRYVHHAALLDSGADFNVFHGDIATYLGISLTKGSRRNIWGLGGGPLKGYEHAIILKIKNITYKTRVTFSNQIPDNTLAVLGNKGFFDKFSVNFDYKNKLITLKRNN